MADRPKPKYIAGMCRDELEERMTPACEIFAKRFAVHGCIARASREAGFSDSTGRAILRDNHLARQLIEDFRRGMDDNPATMREQIIRELAAIAFAAVHEVATWDKDGLHLASREAQVDPNATEEEQQLQRLEHEMLMKSIAEVKCERKELPGEEVVFEVKVGVKMHDKIRALQQLAKMLGVDGVTKVDLGGTSRMTVGFDGNALRKIKEDFLGISTIKAPEEEAPDS